MRLPPYLNRNIIKDMKQILKLAATMMLGLTLSAADGNTTAKPGGLHKVKSGPFNINLSLKGTFAPAKAHAIVLRPKAWTDLTVAEDAAAHGTTVSANDVLVKLKANKLEEKIADTRLALELSSLDYAVAVAEYTFATNIAVMDRTVATNALARLEADFKRYEAKTLALSEKSARFSLLTSQNSLAYAEEELKQPKKMYAADDITEETEEIILQRATHAVNRAKHFLERSESTAANTLTATLPREKEDKMDALERARLGTTKTTSTHQEKIRKLKIGLDQQAIALKRAEEGLAKLEADLKLLTVRAPAGGMVYYGKFTDGIWGGQKVVAPKLRKEGKLAAGEVFMTIVEPGLMVVGNIGEADLRKVAGGITGWATPTAEPAHRVPVTVKSISRVPTAPGQYAIQLVANLGGKGYLVPGMSCDIKLKVYENNAAITVPSTALRQNEAGATVLQVKGPMGSTEERVVKIGNSHGGQPVITEGIKAGDEVLLP